MIFVERINTEAMRPLEEKGFEIIESIYSEKEVDEILEVIDNEGIGGKFGVREFLLSSPKVAEKIFNERLLDTIKKISLNCTKSIKSIYFDKPPNANWIVNWHQDLTINLKGKKEVLTYKNWRTNRERTVVQPNIELLENIFTIRIHLDDCTKENGALRVIESSHKQGVIEIKDWTQNKKGEERICEVKKGGILLMKPLLLHSSKRTENEQNRRVIHVEFCDIKLPEGLEWKEAVLFSPILVCHRQI